MEHMCFISHSSLDAPVAQLICHRLEEEGIRCWIAPRDIRHADWAGTIVEGIGMCDVFIVVVSENSIASGEVLKEITEATRSCRYIIPFKLDPSELTMAMRYHLSPCHWLDASCPPLEERVEDLKKRIESLADEDAVYINNRQMTLKPYMPAPRAFFIGRDEEIDEIADLIKENRVLFLQGMGGIGKSEIARSYAAKYKDRYDTAVFLGYNGSILDLVTGDALTIENLASWDTDQESAQQYFERKMDALCSITSERVLLVLDNFDVDSDPYFSDFINTSCHVLVTTRNDHEDYETFRVGPIQDFNKVRELFIKYLGKSPKPEDMPIIDEMLELIRCHTITVELLAKQMKASRRKPADMLALLKSGGMNTHLKEKVKRQESEEASSSFDFIRSLFRFSDLDDNYKDLLRYMTLVPYTGLDISLFYDICELDSYDELNTLIAHSWLMLDEDTDYLSMHPIIADVVREELKPTQENTTLYIKGVSREVGNLWHKSREEKKEQWPLYQSIITIYPDPSEELWRDYASMSSNAWICGRYALSIDIGHRVLESVKAFFPGDLKALGLAARNLGGCYHNSGDDVSAEPYYKMGLESQKASINDGSDPKDKFQLATSYQKVGRCAYIRGDFETSRRNLEESLRICNQDDMKTISGGDTLVELARMYIAMGDYEAALPYAVESIERMKMIYGKETANFAYGYNDMGQCYTALGDFAKAKECLENALRINMEYHGENSLQTFFAREAMVDLAAAEGDHEKADELFTALEVEMESCFGGTSPRLKMMREKHRFDKAYVKN